MSLARSDLEEPGADIVVAGVRVTTDETVLDGPRGAAGARLHLQFVDRMAGIGAVLLGWLSDPLDHVASVTADAGSGDPVDLETDAAACLLQDRQDIFRVPRAIAPRSCFVAFIADPSGDGHLSVTVRLRTGAAHRQMIAATGDASRAADMLDRAPLSYGLAVVAHLLSGYRASGAGAMPRLIDMLAAKVFDRIDRQQECGTARGRSALECYIDAATRIGTLGILLKGWLLVDDADRMRDIALVSLSGRRVPVALKLPRVARPDVIEAMAGKIASQDRDCGFVTFVPIADLDVDDRLWFIQLATENGAARRTPFVCGPEPVPLHGIETVVALAEPNAVDLDDLFARAIAPPLRWFWSQAHRDRPSPTERIYGDPPRGARVSVIVPLYGRMDFVRHQIANFSNDPDFRAAAGMVELIYVLDDPSGERELRRLSRLLYDTYGVPFRTVLLGGNFGYSSANNAGARAATGEKLLLLNSDVIPTRSRWVSQLAKLYGSLDGCGILGCRLLFEDGSIQHAGMNFRRSPVVAGAWDNDHPGKGLSTSFDPHTAPAAVAAVTGACLMIDRALYGDVGGLSEGYVIGDFEDSDLCLKIHERDLNVYYTPDVELYHLERQSMQRIARGHEGWRQSLTLFNMWQHGQRWKADIPVIAARYGGAPETDMPRAIPVPDQDAAPAKPPAPIYRDADARPVRRSHGSTLPGFLAAISPPPFRARLQELCDEESGARVLSWMLGDDGMLEWGHCVGVLKDAALGATLAPLPPPELRAITAAVEEQEFLWSGLSDVQRFLGLFEEHTQAPARARPRVLDFGCGCGRLVRFLNSHERIEPFGSDINPDLVAWCQSALRHTRVTLNEAVPPLPFDDGSFELVFSLSVFTHLARERTALWLAELARVLVPGGVLVVTTHGYVALETIRASEIHQGMFRVDALETQDLITRLPLEGHIFLPYQADILEAAKAGEEYGNAFVDPGHVGVHWQDAALQFVAHIPGGLRGWQDVVVMRRL